jgi:hypothetical protein
MAGKRPVVELARAYLKHHRTRAQQDSWAFDEVLQRVSLGPADPEDAWNVVLALVTMADEETLGYAIAHRVRPTLQMQGTRSHRRGPPAL